MPPICLLRRSCGCVVGGSRPAPRRSCVGACRLPKRRSRPAEGRRHLAGRDRMQERGRRRSSRSAPRALPPQLRKFRHMRAIAFEKPTVRISMLRQATIRGPHATVRSGTTCAKSTTCSPKVSIHCAPWPRPRPRHAAGARRRRSPTSPREAGVSAPTVSKVLNGRLDVSPETRHRVEAAHPRARVRAIAASRVRPAPLLELIFHELESDWALEIVKGVETGSPGSTTWPSSCPRCRVATRRAAAGSRA